jgi:photosystem II stability/assembly factor-like uncharacterized protein
VRLQSLLLVSLKIHFCFSLMNSKFVCTRPYPGESHYYKTPCYMTARKTFALFLFFLLVSFYSYSQSWVQTKGPGGGSVIDMVEKNGTLLAATLGGVFRSTDNGTTWSRSHNGIPEGGFMTCFATTPTYIYAAGWSEGLFRSSDNGVSWTSVPINLSSIFILELHCIGEDIYVGCEGAGVVRSINGGASFQFVNTGFPASANVVAFAQAGSYLYAGLAGNGGSVGIYRTPINSINWTQKFVGGIGDIAVKGMDLFITSSLGLFRSTDMGDTWTEPLPGFNDFGGLLTVYQGDVFTAKDGVGVFKSVNDGASWTAANTGLKPLSVFAYLPAATGLYIGFERGIARTTDNAASWDLKSRGLTNTSITSLLADGNRLYATARTINAGSSDGVFYTDDGGQNWTSLGQGLLPNPQATCIRKSGNNLILATSNFGLYIKRPIDAGFVRPSGIPASTIVNTLLTSGQYVLAGTSGDGELYRSSDYGLTWIQSNTGFNNSQTDQVYSLYDKAGVWYAGAFNALYKSVDFGLTWTSSSSGIYPGADITGITSLGNDLYAVDDHNLGIYKSTNNGASWFNVNNGIPPIIKFNTIFSDNATLYAGSDFGVYRSINNGASWAEYNAGLLPKRAATSFAKLGSALVLGTDETAVWGQGLSVLPLRLESFITTVINNNYIKASWVIAEETGIGNYFVERAIEGTSNFIPIGVVAASNTPGKKYYELIDRDAKRNVVYQYRLRIEDGNVVRYSPISLAKITGANVLITVMPNPATEFIRISINGYVGNASVSILNAGGQTVYQKQQKASGSNVVVVDVRPIVKGMYFIRVKMENNIYTQKVFVQ